MGIFTTTTINSRAELIINAGDGPTLIFNDDPNVTIYLGSDLGIQGGVGNVAPLPPLATAVLDGKNTVYAVTMSGQTANMWVYPGGLNFFQLVELIVKTIIVSSNLNPHGGLYIYDGTPGPGNPPILSACPDGVSTDPFGNTVLAVLNIGNFSANHSGFANDGNFFVSDIGAVNRIIIETGNVGFGNVGAGIKMHDGAGTVWTMLLSSATGNIWCYAGGLGSQQPLSAAIVATSGSSDPQGLGNFAATGFSGPIHAFQPGSSPLTQETWHNLTLASPWTASGVTPQYRIESTNVVRLRGQLKNTLGAYTAFTDIATLPAAYQPANVQWMPVNQGASSAVSGMKVNAGGNPQIVQAFAINVGLISLDGITFPLD